MKIITRKQAQAQNLKHFFTGKPCKNGHTAARFTSSSGCVECHKEKNKSYWQKRYAKDKEAFKARNKKWRDDNKQTVREMNARYHNNNPDVAARHYIGRTQSLKQACPSWADKTAIKTIYQECKRLNDLGGEVYEVDHHFPLNGETVCGLHVADNLEIITREANRQKSNKLN